MYDTPVRHDDLSITKTSLRSKVLISANNQRISKETMVKHGLPEGKGKNMRGLLVAPSTNINCCTPNSEKKITDYFPIVDHKTSEINIIEDFEMVTPCENIDRPSSRTSDYDTEEGSVVLEERPSTPSVMQLAKVPPAESSTPNQELANNSKLARNVSTQTTFTLNIWDSAELTDDLKSYCVELPDDNSKHVAICAGNTNHNTNTDNTSPLSRICAGKSINCHKTPVGNKTASVRKLSLRSKTMICSAMEKTKDRPNILTRFKSAEEGQQRLFSNTFSTLPHPKTPPSCVERVFHNPFEVDLPERLGKSLFSPDVFHTVVSPSQDSEEIRWTIEDISSINPVPIEEDFIYPSDDEDPERESQVQQEIDKYFSETHLVLSPFDAPRPFDIDETKRDIFHVETTASTPQKHNKYVSVESKNANTQTVLILPEILPDEVEGSLKCLFKCYETDDFNSSASNLRRKLFFHSEDEPPSPVQFEICSSPVTNDLWKNVPSPFSTTKNERHFTPVARHYELSSPEMSPVVPDSESIKSKNDSISSCKKTLYLYYGGDTKEVKDVGPVVNSTVIASCAEGPSEMVLDSSAASSALPASQDTGYNTEESWRQSTQVFTTPNKVPNFCSTMMASTPSHRV